MVIGPSSLVLLLQRQAHSSQDTIINEGGHVPGCSQVYPGPAWLPINARSDKLHGLVNCKRFVREFLCES